MKVLKRIMKFIIFIIIGLLIVILYARYIEPNLLFTNKVTVKTTGQKQASKVVFFSDTHFGELYNQTKIEQIVEKINKAQPEIVVFGGDFIDWYYRDKDVLDLEYLSEQLNKIEAKYAKIAVWGNHDYGGGSAKIYKEVMNNGGFEVLKNESIFIEELNMKITGLDDFLLGKPNVDTTQLLPDNFNLIVSHAPDIVDSMDLQNVDFAVSGHSHGGQIYLPFVTDKILPKGARTYTRGLYDVDGAKLFVSTGLGTTQLPYRFLNIPQIYVFEIT